MQVPTGVAAGSGVPLVVTVTDTGSGTTAHSDTVTIATQ
jgi:hypothetical protein